MKYAGRPEVTALEVGVWEGRSTLWFLSEVLNDETARIVCIDPRCSPHFFDNIKPYRHKVRLIRESSQVALRDRAFAPDSFDFVYIDGDHEAPSVLEDAVLCFRLLKRGGVLIFDDYMWKGKEGDPLREPKLAIDAFTTVFERHCRVLHRGWQVVLEKL